SAEQLDALSTSSAIRLQYVLEAESECGVRRLDIPVRTGCTPAEVQGLVEQTGGYVGAHNLYAASAVEQVMASVRRIVAEYEIRSPLALGVPARTLREGLRVHDELADIAISEMKQAGSIESYGPLLRRPGWVPSPSDRD